MNQLLKALVYTSVSFCMSAHATINNDPMDLLLQDISSHHELSVSDSAAEFNLRSMAKSFSYIESDNKPFAKNPRSTASGYMQYTKPAFETAKRRAAMFSKRTGAKIDWLESAEVTELSYQQQVELLLIDLWQRKDSVKELVLLAAQGNSWAQKQLYQSAHHTNPCEVALQRMNAYINYNYLIREEYR